MHVNIQMTIEDVYAYEYQYPQKCVMRESTLSKTMVKYPTNMMTVDQAAVVIQNAWRVFDHDRKAAFNEEYQSELMDTYYRECCSPGDWDIAYAY
jgi:hypothetical protein